MTCHDARDRFSALLDDALAVPERQALDAHLAACAECRRELEQLHATVALLGRLPSVRAPAGFVDRVMARAYPPPWPRRLLDALFVPLRVKLPLEAAAVLLVGVSALYVYQHAPEVQQLARQETRESSPAPAVAPAAPPSGAASTPPAARSAGPVGGSPSGGFATAPAPTPLGQGQAGVAGKPRRKEEARELERAPVEQGAAREEARQGPPAVAQPAPPVALAPLGSAARGNDAREAPAAKPAAKKEAQAERRPDAFGAATSPAGSEKVAQSAEPSPARDAVGTRSSAVPSTAGAAAPSATSPAPARPDARGRVGGVTPAPPATPTTEGTPGEALSTAKSQVAARLLRAVDASGRLAVPAREPAETALDALLERLGATRVGRRLEGDQGLVVLEVLVPGARYRELVEGLGRIGRWVTDHEPGTLPAEVRVEVALTVEP